MNTKISLAVLGLALAGCASGSASPYDDQLDQATASWARDKAGCATYHYVRSTSSWTGSTSQTDVEITNDRATRRRYVEHVVQDNGQVKTDQWDETGPAVGSHIGAFQARTIEQLLADCRRTVAQDPQANKITLVVGAHGVPSDCLFVPKNCADDCAMGVTLSDFACVPLSP
jgi:hypothetical protein